MQVWGGAAIPVLGSISSPTRAAAWAPPLPAEGNDPPMVIGSTSRLPLCSWGENEAGGVLRGEMGRKEKKLLNCFI